MVSEAVDRSRPKTQALAFLLPQPPPSSSLRRRRPQLPSVPRARGVAGVWGSPPTVRCDRRQPRDSGTSRGRPSKLIGNSRPKGQGSIICGGEASVRPLATRLFAAMHRPAKYSPLGLPGPNAGLCSRRWARALRRHAKHATRKQHDARKCSPIIQVNVPAQRAGCGFGCRLERLDRSMGSISRGALPPNVCACKRRSVTVADGLLLLRPGVPGSQPSSEAGARDRCNPRI